MTPQAAVAVLRVADAVLLLRRSQRPGDPWSGHWALPGGRIEADDASPMAAARRELREETAIDLGQRSADAALGVSEAGRLVQRPIAVAAFLWRLPVRAHGTPTPAEAVELCWCDLVVLAGTARQIHTLADGQQVPCVQLGMAPLWGYTLRVLEGLRVEGPGLSAALPMRSTI
jgi:8-oxo-dGTP pyrophosphatase MutT (NUDIX family)